MNIIKTLYHTTCTLTETDKSFSTYSYLYDANGYLAYESVARERYDNITATPGMSERRMVWDAENRLRGLSDGGYASFYWYDSDGSRTVKRHGGGEMLYVNSQLRTQRADSATYSLYPHGWYGIDNFSRLQSLQAEGQTKGNAKFLVVESAGNVAGTDHIEESLLHLGVKSPPLAEIVAQSPCQPSTLITQLEAREEVQS